MLIRSAENSNIFWAHFSHPQIESGFLAYVLDRTGGSYCGLLDGQLFPACRSVFRFLTVFFDSRSNRRWKITNPPPNGGRTCHCGPVVVCIMIFLYLYLKKAPCSNSKREQQCSKQSVSTWTENRENRQRIHRMREHQHNTIRIDVRFLVCKIYCEKSYASHDVTGRRHPSSGSQPLVEPTVRWKIVSPKDLSFRFGTCVCAW